MVRQVCSDTDSLRALTLDGVRNLLSSLHRTGVREITLCPGSRNAFFVQELSKSSAFRVVSFFDERSAGFYTLGRIKSTGRPAAIMTTSGTAAAELLPSIIEAHYLNLPMVAVTADRPKRFAGSGSPNAIEQPGLYSHYTAYEEDIEADSSSRFETEWSRLGPLHLNVRFEDPRGTFKECFSEIPSWKASHSSFEKELDLFFAESRCPLAIVAGLSNEERAPVRAFLKQLGLPAYFEAPSGLREDPSLQTISIRTAENMWRNASEHGYPIDGILRIGSVPTLRPWRDLDDKEGQLPVLSLSSLPFPGLHWGRCVFAPLQGLSSVRLSNFSIENVHSWMEYDALLCQRKRSLFEKYPRAEASLVYRLSQLIPGQALVYLGNSLPIREWDLAADYAHPHPHIACSRGANGIDGQISTFLGMCDAWVPSWGIFGDLTALYDLTAFWAVRQTPGDAPQCVIINNGGGKIFDRMYPEKLFQNNHSISFGHAAAFWGLHYERWETVPASYRATDPAIIEIVPDEDQTQLFWKEWSK